MDYLPDFDLPLFRLARTSLIRLSYSKWSVTWLSSESASLFVELICFVTGYLPILLMVAHWSVKVKGTGWRSIYHSVNKQRQNTKKPMWKSYMEMWEIKIAHANKKRPPYSSLLSLVGDRGFGGAPAQCKKAAVRLFSYQASGGAEASHISWEGRSDTSHDFCPSKNERWESCRQIAHANKKRPPYSSLLSLVGDRGFEPLTSSTSMKRSSQMS